MAKYIKKRISVLIAEEDHPCKGCCFSSMFCSISKVLPDKTCMTKEKNSDITKFYIFLKKE
jgi:hypothetical protein